MIIYEKENKKEKELPEVKVVRALSDIQSEIRTLSYLDINNDVFLDCNNIKLIYFKEESPENNERPIVNIIVNENSATLNIISNEKYMEITEEQKKEFKAKAVVLIMLLKQLKKDGFEWIDKLSIVDTFDNKKEDYVDNFIDELASKLLIPEKEFTEDVAKRIYSVYRSTNLGENNMIDFGMLKKLFVENLKRKYNVREYMVNLRIRVADYPKSIGCEETDALSEFVRYKDADLKKENTKKNNKK